MKTQLLLIRHGETDWNNLGKFQGCTDIELNDAGLRQAECVADRINGDYDYIYASPLKRALRTAEIIAEKKDNHVEVAQDIREINFGKWEGLTTKDMLERYPEVFKAWKSDKLEGKFVGGDLSTLNASIRAKNCIMDIVKKHQGKKIIIVAHGGIIKAGLIGLFEMDMTMYHKMFLGNTSITTLYFDDNLNPVIKSINDTNHLDCEVKQV